MMADDYGMGGIHPPNVVLVNSNQTSPDHHPIQDLCSPLSTAPNSPFRVSYEEDDDDDDDEVRPEEVQAVLNTPVSGRRKLPRVEAPFDEGVATTPQADPLLRGNGPAVVSPPDFLEDIDAYVDEEEEEIASIDEKKEEDATPPPQARLPVYAGYPSSKRSTTIVPPSMSDNDSVPHDERQFSPPTKDYNTEEEQSPMQEAVQSAHREVLEMERRVQHLIQKRRFSFGSSAQQRTEQPQQGPSPSNNHTQSTHEEVHLPPYDLEDEEEPPSLSPRRDVHSSLDSGSSSYYYDGSILESSAIDDVNNTTIESTTSSAIGGTTRVAMSIHPPLAELSKIGSSSGSNNKDMGYYSRRSASNLESSREETTTSSSTEPSRYNSYSSSNNNHSKADSPPTAYEAFKFDQESGTNSSFADLVSGTSRALNQVSDNMAHFLVLPPSTEKQPKRRTGSAKRSSRTKSYGPPSDQEYPPISPSMDSECTPHMDNLSPRRQTDSSGDVDVDLLYQQKPSAKLAKARSLVSGRHAKSPTMAPYLNHSSSSSKINNSASKDDPKQRARQVMSKRERERPSSARKLASSKREDPPVPPTLHRLAAMMEGLGGSAEGNAGDNGASEEDWSNTVSHFVSEYQTVITDSLKNLSIDEISGLALNSSNEQAPEFGKDTMVSPGVALSPSADCSRDDINSFTNLRDEDYDALMQEMTFGACLQMPQLDHPPAIANRSSCGTAQDPTKEKDYGQGVAGVLQYKGLEYQYHNESDEQPQEEGGEHSQQERAHFAKELSQKLMCLRPNSSSDSGESIEEKYLTPQKGSNINGTSFDPKDSSFMSPPKRGWDANKDGMMTDIGGSKPQGGLFVSNMRGDMPHSEQPSVASESNVNSIVVSPDRGTAKDRVNGTSPAKSVSISDNIKPTMVQSIDNETGIAKGDVMLSLLCDNSFQASRDKAADSWAWRVQEAIWRGRGMRRDCFDGPVSRSNSQDDGDGKNARRRSSSLPVDVDDVRIVGGIKSVSSIQEKALAHLERDEFEQALELYEDIIFNYYSFFEQVLAKRDEYSSEDVSMELANFKPYIGASLHNLGVIHLLKGDYEDAFSFFKRAVDNRRACLGDSHPDCVTSLVRLATCRFAMDNFADAHTNLELSLALAGSKARTTNDYSQLGEILNNLGCLSYMCGQPTKAMKLFRESLDVQLAVLNSTLYGGSKYSSHTATLNLTVTRGNIGFLALVLRDVSSGILALEAALKEQRLLLNGAHVTLVSTMDHLAVANLLEGRTQKATKMLRRIYELQRAAHGPNDPRSLATRQKIMTIRGQQEDSQMDSSQAGTRQRRQEESKSSGPGAQQYETYTQKQANDSKPPAEVPASSKAPPNPNNNNNGNSGGGKVGSVFKAIRSLGRKKN